MLYSSIEDVEDMLALYRSAHYFPLAQKTQIERDLLDTLITFYDDLKRVHDDHVDQLEERG